MKNKLFFFISSLLVFSFPALATPQAIVFDFGGVMTIEADHSSRVFKAAADFIREHFNLTESAFAEVNNQRHLALKRGESDEKFLTNFAEEKALELPDNWYTSFQTTIKNAAEIDVEMYQLVNELKPYFQIGLFSNSDGQFTSLLKEVGIYEPFNPCLLSSEMGIRKPDPRAFELLLLELNLSPEEIVYIDDKIENIDTANNLGMDGILFESPQQLIIEFVKRQILSVEITKTERAKNSL